MRARNIVSLSLFVIAALIPTCAVAQRNYIFSLFDAPTPGDVTWTFANAQNNAGQIVGYYYYYISATQTWKCCSAFLKVGDTYTAIDDPHDPGDTIPNGINNNGQIVGYFGNHGHSWGGTNSFSFLITNNTFTLLTAPNDQEIEAMAINDAGQIVGQCWPAGVPGPAAFLLDGSSFTCFSYPGAMATSPNAINNIGQIAGNWSYKDASGIIHNRGFLKTGTTFEPIDYPGAAETWVWGINNRSEIAGVYYDPGTSPDQEIHGFIYSNGAFTTIDYPPGVSVSHPPSQTFSGINDNEQVVGGYLDPDNVWHGLIGTCQNCVASAPTTSASSSPGPNGNGWNNTNVTITLNAVDYPSGTGIKQIQFGLSGASNTGLQTVAGSTASVAISLEGITTVTYFATDNAGSQETPNYRIVQIDKTKPVSHASALAATQTTYSFPVSWAGTDSLSGVQGFTIYVSDNGGSFTPWLTNTATTQATFTGLNGHKYGFYSLAIDRAGNIESSKHAAEATTVIAVPTISLWANTVVGIGQTVLLPVTLSAPAPSGGVTVTLTSSSPNTVASTPGVFIPAGKTSPNLQPSVKGLNLGTVQVTAQAPGYVATSQSVRVTASLGFARCCITVNGSPVMAVLNLSAPAPSTGLTIQLSSDNTTVATVPATVTFPPNATTTSVPVTGVAPGSTTIHAGAPPNIPNVTIKVTVQ